MYMKYFFILGSNPALSFAEIKSVLALKPENIIFITDKVLAINYENKLIAHDLMRDLGGTIKMGVLKDECYEIDNDLVEHLWSFIDIKNVFGKFNFGFSYYGEGSLDIKSWAINIKRQLKESGINSRWVVGRVKQLSSVIVEQNKLIGAQGLEIVIVKREHSYYLGKTMAVQPFKELSARDYGRPGRDDYSGMLPPKLAKIMINLAGGKSGFASDKTMCLLDPFCGSGTILTEALLMGYKYIIGTDKSATAVADTKKNLIWIKNKYPAFKLTSHIWQCDARVLAGKIKPNSVDIIATEPYLGPPRMRRKSQDIKKVTAELEQLYHEAILQFDKILKNNGRVTMVWPVFITDKNEQVFLNTKNILKNSSFQKIDYLLGFKYKTLILTDRRTLLYKREGQKIAREIVALTKINKGERVNVTKK